MLVSPTGVRTRPSPGTTPGGLVSDQYVSFLPPGTMATEGLCDRLSDDRLCSAPKMSSVGMRKALQRVAVIGAGAAGLCAARHILSRPERFAPPVLFEQSENIGGTWCYKEGDSGRPVHSSMYRDLRTNLPKEVMMFPDFPFDPSLSSFLPHHEVQRYLESYCQTHRIRPHVRFNTAVVNVTPVAMAPDSEEDRTTWEVTSSDPAGVRQTETFDAVFVCSGHYSDPHVPSIPGVNSFKGTLLHSHTYRFAEPFSGQSVVVLGAGASGLDISMELATAGAQVTLSHGRPPFTFPLPPGVRQSVPVASVQEDGSIRFQDDSVTCADVLLLCTGYNFRYPFLDASQLGLQIQDHLVAPLYRYMMPPAFPTLFFIGICKIICPFPHFHCQVQFALAVLDGSVTLPPLAQMEDETLRELRGKTECGVQQHHLLKMDQDQWEYCRGLARSGSFPPLPPVIRSLYEEVWQQRRVHPGNYRKLNYRLLTDTRWELTD